MVQTEYWYADLIKSQGLVNDDCTRTGEWNFYTEEGFLEEKGSYNAGLKQGQWIEYDGTSENKVIIITTYKDDLKQGEYKSFYLDGSIQVVGNYINDSAIGEWIEFDVDNNIHRKEYYENGEKHGAWEMYIKGELVWVNNYQNNLPIGMHQLYRYDIVVKKGLYESGIENGLWNYYHDTGELGATGNYKSGVFDGEWVFLDKLKSEIGRAFFEKGKLINSNGEVFNNDEEVMGFCETWYC
jgi:antitoxin component YwqK of YwqJK toxin-antitoxin module